MKWQVKKCIPILVYVFVLFHNTGKAYTPELVVGNRSVFYQHRVNARINRYLSFNNLAQIDLEYAHIKNNIYFIRNTLSFEISPHFSLNTSFGIKNPGSFSTLFINYNYTYKEFVLNYAIGITQQKGLSIEHSFSVENNFSLTSNLQLNTRFQALLNHTNSEYHRGFQQVRLGLKRNEFILGVAINYDQFNNNDRLLANYGFYIKQIIKK